MADPIGESWRRAQSALSELMRLAGREAYLDAIFDSMIDDLGAEDALQLCRRFRTPRINPTFAALTGFTEQWDELVKASLVKKSEKHLKVIEKNVFKIIVSVLDLEPTSLGELIEIMTWLNERIGDDEDVPIIIKIGLASLFHQMSGYNLENLNKIASVGAKIMEDDASPRHGPRANEIKRVSDEMRRDISLGQLRGLSGIPIKQLAYRYRTSEPTASRARKGVLQKSVDELKSIAAETGKT